MKRGVLGWGGGAFYVRTYLRKGCVSEEQGLGVEVWAKRDPIWAKTDPIWAICAKSGQKCSRIGPKKNPS